MVLTDVAPPGSCTARCHGLRRTDLGALVCVAVMLLIAEPTRRIGYERVASAAR